MISKVNSSGKEEFSNQTKDDILISLDDIVKEYAAKKYRIVIVAHKTYQLNDFGRDICKLKVKDPDFQDIYQFFNEGDFNTMDERRKTVEDNLAIQAIFGIQDNERGTAGHSVKLLQEQRITVRMVTGDSIQASRAVAEKCGIIAKSTKSQTTGNNISTYLGNLTPKGSSGVSTGSKINIPTTPRKRQ